MKTCVIYAASIFQPEKLPVLEDFFKVFNSHFLDADFYVGLNYRSMPIQEDLIRHYVPNCTFMRVENGAIYDNSEAAAYQMALKALKQSGKTYDVCWFGHTKGGQNARPGERRLYLDEMFGERKTIEAMFEQYPMLGSWGIRGNSISAVGVQWKNYNVDLVVPVCANTKFPPFNCTHVNWSYLEGMYVLKGVAVDAYVKLLTDAYFDTRMDRYYFETVPPWLPSRCGYFPYVKRKMCFWAHLNRNLQDVTKQWIDENNLTDLNPYLSI